MHDCKLKQAICVKYLGAFLDYKLTSKNHIEHAEFKLSTASGAIYKLGKYVPQEALMSVYCSLACILISNTQLFAGKILPKPFITNCKSNKIVS